MENKKYFCHPTGKMNQDFQMDDEQKNPVFEAKVLKKGIFSAWQFEFVNHVTNSSEVHKVGHTVTTEEHVGSGTGIMGGIASGVMEMMSTRSWFKYDGTKIWDYLHEKGIRIESHMASGRLGMSYKVTLKGQDLATLTMSMPEGKKSIISGKFWYDVDMAGDDLELTFLTAFAIARTEQTLYS